MDIRQQLLAAFEIEHREHLDAIRAALSAEARSEPADWTDVFRRAHSLKGAARAVDLPAVEALAHRMETLFERVGAGRDRIDAASTAAIHLALDRIEAYVAEVGANPDAASPSMPEDAIAALDRCLDPAAPSPLATDAGPVSDVPATPRPEPAAGTEPAGEPGSAMLRVPASAVEALTQATHGLAGVLPREALVSEGAARIVASASELRRRVETLRRSGRDRGADGMRAELSQIEAGLGALARLAADLSRNQRAFAASLETASARLHAESERLALVPAETVFGGFARSLREMAREEGREVEVTLRGLDLPIERSILQSLKDPVLHALRNALSHGGEPAERRRHAGKPPALAIVFEVAVQGGRLIIGIHDDGRGPDLSAIALRARDRGLLAPDAPTDADGLLALAFEPGFSTAPAIDTLSGRGIGLAVVADAVRRLNGSVRLEPRRPCGASLIMSLPLAAAQRSVLIVEAGGATYGLPGAAVERLMRLETADLGTVLGRRIARVGTGAASTTLPLCDLARLLGAENASGEETMPAVLVRSGETRIVLTVDRLHEVRSLLVLPRPAFGADDTLFSGTVILAGQRPALVLDPEGLIARTADAERPADARAGPPRPAGEPQPAVRRSTILVVDDSITTRTLEKSILEAAGYRVVVCVDGQDALDRLKSGIEPVDLVVADVEMPRLDGFGLLGALRREESFARLPVILMTSRGDSEDIARGLELGADAYLTKQKFDQRELLDTIGQLL